MVNVDSVKMSKSLGNFTTIRDLLKSYPGEVIRYFALSAHYRSPIDFSKARLDEAKTAYQHLKNIISTLKDGEKANEKYTKEFKKAMDDDLNTPKALAVLWNLVRDEKAKGKLKTIEQIDSVFNLNLLKKEEVSLSKEIKELIEKREEARKKKDFKSADQIRDKIKSLGYSLEDTPEGVKAVKL
jgi:cysteinyl-tRNA synthetase